MKARFFYAVATLSGTMIGAGLFALPYAIMKVGFWPGLAYMLVLSAATAVLMFAYLEVVLSTKGMHHQMVSYAGKYLGKGGKVAAAVAQVLGQYGSLLVYVIAAGEVLFFTVGRFLGGDERFYGLGFALFCTIAIYLGVSALKKLELGLLIFVIAAVFFIFFFGFGEISWSNLNIVNLSNIMIPFGVVLFAFGGISAITVMDDILAGDKKRLKSAVFMGTAIALIVYVVFVVTAIGIGGTAVTEDAVIGLSESLGPVVTVVGSVMLLLTIATSFFTLGFSLKEVFEHDLRLGRTMGLVLMVAVPLAIYFANIAGFVRVVGLTGALLVGVQGIIVFMMYLQVKRLRERRPECSFKFPKTLVYLIIVIFLIGVISEIVRLIV